MYKIEKLEWDSNHFDLTIGNVIFEENEVSNLEKKYDIILAKVGIDKTEEIKKLQNNGFILKDTLIRFYIENIQNDKFNKNSLVKLAKENNLEEIKKIARDSFKKSHFYKNENLQEEKIDELYEKWVINKFKKNNIYIYEEENIVKGFLLGIENSEEAIIDLIAVDSRFKGNGIGKELILKFFQLNIKKKSYVGTQITNISAIKLYEKLGYKIFDFTYIFHKNNFGE
ncbi:GNAT family N-acetyltransferase [Cetobacterium sp.]|uniref:GNAT family N-acetyltransferase n=1 Tax=Cetobacterium sp. TaxID=2071632 RepID=UPI003EE7DF69